MADDDRTRRRLGDETKSRIAGLASGWSVESPASEPAPAPEDVDPPRKKQRTIPPPAPGSPERKAFEQQIVATTADREDATDVLPPKRPTGAQQIVAATPTRDDATDQLVEPRPNSSPVAARSAGDPRATHSSSPPPPPQRARNATGQQPLASSAQGTRSHASTGPQPVVGERAKGSTGQQRVVTPEPTAARPQTSTGPHSVIGGRARTGTGQLSIIPNIPMRAASSTGQQAATPRTRSATGGHAIIPTRSQTGTRSRAVTGQQPIVDERERDRVMSATGPHSILSARTKGGTGEQPVVAERERDRVTSATGPHSILPARAKEGTGGEPVVATRSPERTGGQPIARPNAPSGAHGVVAAPADSSGTQPHSGVPSRRAGASVPPPVPLATPRTKTSSVPPPPPGSPERAAAERGSAYTTQPFGSADRKKPPTAPPPPGEPSSAFATQPLGSADRKKSASAPPPPPPPHTDRSKPVSAPPPHADRSKPASAPPPASDRSKPTSMPPVVFPTSDSWSTTAPASEAEGEIEPAVSSGPRFPRATNDGPAVPFSTASSTEPRTPFATEGRTFSVEPRTPAVIIDASLDADPAASTPAKQTVPTGEFDSGVRTVRDHQTNPRDAAEALLAIPHTETPVEELLEDDEDDDNEAARRPLHAAPDPATEKFERGDPTQDAPPDGTQIEHVRTKHPTGGTLRTSAALRRKRGLWGDVRYVATAVFGVRRSRREVLELDHRQGLRQTSRRRHLITLGRTAAVMDNFDHPSLGKSREQLASIEDERSKHAGAVAASDAELERVRRDRDNSAKQYAIATSEADAEIAELAKKLEPVEKEALVARKRASDLRDELRRIEKQIADAEASLVSSRSDKVDKPAVQADIATYKANKVAVLRDEPIIAAELDALDPQIAALEATRTGLEKKKTDLAAAEHEDQRRTLELLEAIGAKRKVVERAAADAEAARDNALFELGERLYVDRPSILTAQLSPIDRIDLELGEGERRSMELREILSNIDKWKFARGLAMIILAVGLAASLAMVIASAAL